MELTMQHGEFSVWSIVDGTDVPPRAEPDEHAIFITRRDRALAVIVLSVQPNLLYLLGELEDPVRI